MCTEELCRIFFGGVNVCSSCSLIANEIAAHIRFVHALSKAQWCLPPTHIIVSPEGSINRSNPTIQKAYIWAFPSLELEMAALPSHQTQIPYLNKRSICASMVPFLTLKLQSSVWSEIKANCILAATVCASSALGLSFSTKTYRKQGEWNLASDKIKINISIEK